MKIKMNEAAAFETRQGKTYYFCSERCRDLFRKNQTAAMK
jgi:YHS domain-containing protein